MEELFQNYSTSEIILFLICLSMTIKGMVSFYDWAKDRLKKVFNKEDKPKQNRALLDEYMEKNNKQIKSLSDQITKSQEENQQILKLVNILIESDKDDIKSWITEKHHQFCYQEKEIDDYSLDCVERRYGHYVEEGGNSFIGDLMKDIRNLPKK